MSWCRLQSCRLSRLGARCLDAGGHREHGLHLRLEGAVVTLIRMRLGQSIAVRVGDAIFESRWCRLLQTDSALRQRRMDAVQPFRRPRLVDGRPYDTLCRARRSGPPQRMRACLQTQLPFARSGPGAPRIRVSRRSIAARIGPVHRCAAAERGPVLGLRLACGGAAVRGCQ
jgi:hypothetical protein